MIDLSAAPFYLDAASIRWVQETYDAMSPDERIGQLFINMGESRDEAYLADVLNRYHIAGVRYRPGPAREVRRQNEILQANAKVPVLIAANTESGGDGAATDGTNVGFPIKVAATGETRLAYELGRVSGADAAAVGCNWSFAPIVDLQLNWRNPIIASRAFSSDPDTVLSMARAFIEGLSESGIAATAKHFPGDGVDERDHHLSRSVNSLSCEEWDATFGKVYGGLIDDGLPAIMAGHMLLPSYQRHFHPGLRTEELLPASVSPEILNDLLRGRLGFNGVIVSDASHMVGFTAAMSRRELLPRSIAAGCDLLLFFNDPDEDFGFVKEGWESGVISDDRLRDAVTRTLGLKAMLGLHTKDRALLVPQEDDCLRRIAEESHKAVADEVASSGITLVKNSQPGLIPLSPARTPRVLVVPVSGPTSPIAAAFGGSDQAHPAEEFARLLETEGFQVELYESTVQKLLTMPESERAAAVRSVYSGKSPISKLTDHHDLVIVVAKVEGIMQTVARPQWGTTKGTWDIPWYVHELPTIVVSVASPFLLADIPQARTYVNAYDSRSTTLAATIAKLTGAQPFTGASPVDAFCATEDTTF